MQSRDEDALAYHRLHALCTQFDSVLQGRAMLLTSQSILLSVAAFVSQNHARPGVFPWLPAILFAMGMFLLVLWARVVIPGSRDVAYCQWKLLLLEAGERDELGSSYYTDLVRWQQLRGAAKMQTLREHPLGASLGRANQSRRLLNYGLPAAFALCWIALVAYIAS